MNRIPDFGPRVLGLFAKWPAPGSAKTRLGPDPEWNACAARAFLLDTIDRLAGIDARRVLVFAPRSAEADFAALVRGRFALTPQADGDLGRRLSDFIDGELRAGAGAVVVVGADSPTLPVEYVERAYRELEAAGVVIGPALDGGYYLLGCGPRLPPVLDGIDWGTNRVLAQTVERLADPAWQVAVLPPWYDIDTLDDWALLRGHVAALRRSGIDPGVPHTEALLREPAP